MTDILSAIHDDIEEYRYLCEKYGEKVQTKKTAQGVSLPNCYGEHASTLKERQQTDFRLRQQVLSKLTDDEKRVLGVK